MKYALYIKEHNITGLKYLGYTEQNPYVYKGSGKYWKRHIKKYGNNITTKVMGYYDTKEQLKLDSLYLSKKLNIVKSEQWANLKDEIGDGGPWFFTEEQKAVLGIHLKGKTYEEILGPKKALEMRKARSLSNKKRGPRSEITKQRISATRIQRKIKPWNKKEV